MIHEATIRQFSQDVPDATDAFLSDGRTFEIMDSDSISKSRGEFYVQSVGKLKDVYVFYQRVDNGNGTTGSVFAGWMDGHDVGLCQSTKKGFKVMINATNPDMSEMLVTPEWFTDLKNWANNRTSETQTTFGGDVIMYEWGWMKRSVRLSKNGTVLDMIYEAGEHAYSYFHNRRWKTIRQAIESILAPDSARQIRGEMLEPIKMKPVKKRRSSSSNTVRR